VEDVWLARWRWPEVADHLTRQDSVLLPVGSTEQHGAHLPLGVDAMTPIRLAEDAGREASVPVAPPIWYGWAPHHMAFPGTITLRPETLTALVEDVLTSLVHHGFRRLVVVNGHRIANLPPLQIAVNRVRQRTGALAVVVDPVWLAEDVFTTWAEDTDSGGIGHADGYETAHMLHLFPELVAMEEAPPAATDHPAYKVVDPYERGDRAAYWPSVATEANRGTGGVTGNPRWGTAERGQHLHTALVRNLVDLLRSIRDVEVEVTAPPYPS
jgi:creatinine amidohydrolase